MEQEEPWRVERAFRDYQARLALDRLRWLLDLIQVPSEQLEKYSRKETRYLSDRLAILSNISPGTFRPLGSSDISKLLNEVSEGIRGLRAGKPWDVTVNLNVRVDPRQRSASGIGLYYTRDLSSALRWSVVQFLEFHRGRIAECTAPGCRRLYVKRKAARYCSTRCSQRVRSSRYYDRHSTELSERRHDLYVRQLKREKGAAIKIQRRARRKPGG
jgi:hypothetical protein